MFMFFEKELVTLKLLLYDFIFRSPDLQSWIII